MVYDSKDERSNDPGKVNRYSGVKDGCGTKEPMGKRELGNKTAPGSKGIDYEKDFG